MSKTCENSTGFSSIPKASRGFTLLELLVAISILAVLAATSISLSLSIIRREQVNSIALNFTGWFENVRQLSAKRVSAIDTAGGCTILFSAPSSSLTSGSLIAQLDSADARCGVAEPSKYEFRIPSDLSGSFSFAAYDGATLISTPLKFTFTPRGIWVSDPIVQGDIELRILRNGSGPLRCVLITSTLATVEIGKRSSASSSQSCNDYAAF